MRVMGVRLTPVWGGFGGTRGGFVGTITADGVSVGSGGELAGGGGGGGALVGGVVAIVVEVADAGGRVVLPGPREWRETNSTAHTTIATTATVIATIASTAGVVRYHGTSSRAYASRPRPSYPRSSSGSVRSSNR